MGCPFCRIISGAKPRPARFKRLAAGVMFQPRNPHVPRDPHVDGHMLFVPFTHVESAATKPAVTADVMYLAASYARDLAEQGIDSNLIINCGPHAGQTVHHLHVHVLPRRSGADGVVMPWDHHEGCGCLCTGVPPLTRTPLQEADTAQHKTAG